MVDFFGRARRAGMAFRNPAFALPVFRRRGRAFDDSTYKDIDYVVKFDPEHLRIANQLRVAARQKRWALRFQTLSLTTVFVAGSICFSWAVGVLTRLVFGW